MTDENKGPLSGREPTEPQGPRRKAPMYYAGDGFIKGRPINRADVERLPNGVVSGIRNKAARRLIRGALARKHTRVEQGLALARAMKAQAREVVSDEHYDRSPMAQSRMARRLYESELAIHQEVYVPSKKEIRAMRTQRRKDARRGKKDAIAKLVDRMQGTP